LFRAASVLVVISLAACSSDDGSGNGPSGYSLEILVDTIGEADGRVEVATVTLDAPATDTVEVYLWTDGLSGLELPEPTLFVEAGEESAAVPVRPSDNFDIDADRTHTVSVSVFDQTTSLTLTVEDDEPRTLTLEGPAALVEGDSSARLTVRTAARLGEQVSVVLESEPPGLVDLPPSLTLTAGRDSWQISVSVPDDSLLQQADRPVTVSATPSSLLQAATPLTLPVSDDEPATLSLEALATDLSEADGLVSAGARLTPGAPFAVDTQVALESDNAVLQVPSQVTVPAGSTSVDIPLTLVDNSVLDGDVTVTVTASAAGLDSATLSLPVADDEVANLQVSIQAGALAEGDGTRSDWGTVSLGVTVGTAQTVALASSDESELTVPASVVVLAGADQATFPVTLVDDALLDFAQSVTITASAGDWLDELEVAVADDEPNQLSVVVDDSIEVREGNTTQFDVVSVQTAAPVESALAIAVASGDAGELLVQLQVTVAAGETSTGVSIYAQEDGVPDLDQPVEVTATAAGCLAGSGTVLVRDAESGYVVELLQSSGVEQWIEFAAMPGLMNDSDWAVAERFMIPVGADTFEYQFFRGSAWDDADGDFSINVRLTPDPQVSHVFLPMTMNAGDAGISLTEGTWHTLVVQYDLANTKASLYVDGALISEATAAAWDDSSNSHPLVWGGQYADSGFGVGEVYGESDATFAHMAIWQRQLSATEIESYDGTVDLSDPDLVFSTAIGPDRVYDLAGTRDGVTHGSPRFYRP
jgi:hypothetical protein